MCESLVSVIVPVYNTENFVGRTIESVLNQSFPDFELLLVDDGSTDDSRKICSSYAEKDDRVRCLFLEHGGVSRARNCGIKEAGGDIILFCDSDDTWDECLLQLITDAFQDEECEMVRFGFESENQELLSSQSSVDKIYSQKDLFEKYFEDSIIYTNMSTCCFGGYRKRIIDKYNIRFDERLALGEDGKFVMEYLLRINKILILNRKLYHYYIVFENRVNTTARNLKELYNEYELCEMLFAMFFESYDTVLSEKEKAKIYKAFMDRLIGKLVRFGAYSPLGGLRNNVTVIRRFINKKDIQTAIKYYRSVRKSDSKMIPFCIKHRLAYLLWLVLLSKKDNYYRLYGKKIYGVSIYAKDPLVNYQKKNSSL